MRLAKNRTCCLLLRRQALYRQRCPILSCGGSHWTCVTVRRLIRVMSPAAIMFQAAAREASNESLRGRSARIAWSLTELQNVSSRDSPALRDFARGQPARGAEDAHTSDRQT